MAKDIVCGMEVKSPSRYFVHFNNKHYEFCSENCKNKFTAEPERYIEAAGEKSESVPKEHHQHSALYTGKESAIFELPWL